MTVYIPDAKALRSEPFTKEREYKPDIEAFHSSYWEGKLS